MAKPTVNRPKQFKNLTEKKNRVDVTFKDFSHEIFNAKEEIPECAAKMWTSPSRFPEGSSPSD